MSQTAVGKLDTRTIEFVADRVAQVQQINSSGVRDIVEGMARESRWDQTTLEFLRRKAQEEIAKGPNQMVGGWIGYLNRLAVDAIRAHMAS